MNGPAPVADVIHDQQRTLRQGASHLRAREIPRHRITHFVGKDDLGLEVLGQLAHPLTRPRIRGNKGTSAQQ